MVLSDVQIKLLKSFDRKALPDPLTVGDALVAVTALGGHLKRNDAPGWLTLGRGLERPIE